ncbi:hypothetical protein FFLO_05187 [Filobasidium floriforme]|uniref:Uncharacterized protein n=1 Tax=Filobasidium floriforme TaxID=5210 RepID=A0A8K0JHE6_9TREE|nr:uncharacterized protein HD553DRAFT_73496 [Filobasidium floriforme]KAG7530194.1 hypothetical protein FFLO_05187 [Filobasidium floriforme]KAH8081770.1 hypothetical protein HD553DRAFT_73496 [Filobasidium floriforme]
MSSSGTGRTRVDSTGGHSALPIVYGLKASSLLFCWFVLVWLFCRAFRGRTGRETSLPCLEIFAREKIDETGPGHTDGVLTILLTRY